MWLNLNCGCSWRKNKTKHQYASEEACIYQASWWWYCYSEMEGSHVQKTNGVERENGRACFRDKSNLHLRQHPAGEAQRRRGSVDLVPRESDSLRRFRKHACPRYRLIWQRKIASWSFLPSLTFKMVIQHEHLTLALRLWAAFFFFFFAGGVCKDLGDPRNGVPGGAV